jgi:succinate dehydrogenase / fumarate reductase iron-sulfur subunit
VNGFITASIFRYDPEKDAKPHYDKYRIKVDEEISVLVLLKRIQEDLDETLSFRSYCCGLQMCRSCLMKVNHKKRFACLTLVKPGEQVVIEPATYPDSHIKDLVVKLADKRGIREK